MFRNCSFPMICRFRPTTANNFSFSFINASKKCSTHTISHHPAYKEPDYKYTKNIAKIDSALDKDSSDTESPYYFENGLRKVYPYFFPYSTHCKSRWFNRKLIDVYCSEFASCSREWMDQRISKGLLKVNGNVINTDYKLKDGDFITSTIHKHELPVLLAPINVIYEDEDLLVVDKPPSIPVHPCGLYRYNTIVFILGQHKKWRSLKVVNRLDRLASGVLVFAKNSKKSSEIHAELKFGSIHKEYLCRVEGEFPDGVIVCNKPLKKAHSPMGISLIHHRGKKCTTEFQKLSFNGRSSVVRCTLLTGRTHQIRIHLQYLGYPILNDPLYNSYAFGPEKGKHGRLHKSVDQLLKDLLEEHSSKWWEEDSECKKNLVTSNNLNLVNSNLVTSKHLFDEKINKRDMNRFTYAKDCLHCQKPFRDPNQNNLIMLLHAYKYSGKNWNYITEIPKWASCDWNEM